jgi:hypothetical protein
MKAMPFRTHILCVANRTVDSPELLEALKARAAAAPVHVTLLAPTPWSERAEAQKRLDATIASLAEAGIEAEGLLGDADPIVAVQETWNPGRFDDVIVSTFASPFSAWMRVDLPHRVQKLTDCTVHHIQAGPWRPPRPPEPAPQPERRALLPSVLSLMRSRTRRADQAQARY